MSLIKGYLEATLLLNKENCYFMRTGKCSLHMVSAFSAASLPRQQKNDLLYCPELLASMRRKEKNGKTVSISVIPCDCGHAELVAGPQRACIASQQHMPLLVRVAKNVEKRKKKACRVCGDQLSFDGNPLGMQIVTVRGLVLVKSPNAPAAEEA